ncbi:MAG: nucleotidyltransferase family protein [Planctomycetota bacterium]|nr:nucleotidyltransferase family protein [Planctomycetota bacterium]
MGLREQLHNRREEIMTVAARHGARSVRVFGSAARGEERPDSDVDFLVEMEPGRSLFDMGGLLLDLQDLLGRKVDLVEPQGLHWYVRDRVLREAKAL